MLKEIQSRNIVKKQEEAPKVFRHKTFDSVLELE